MTCFADINVSQGSVATHARCGGIFNTHLTGNLPWNLPVTILLHWLRFDRIMVMSIWPPLFWPTLYIAAPARGDAHADRQRPRLLCVLGDICKSFPPYVAFLFFFRTDSTYSRDCLPILLSLSGFFYFLIFPTI